MRKDSPLAEKEAIEKNELLEIPLLCSRQVVGSRHSENKFAEWFGTDYEKLNIVATYNLCIMRRFWWKRGWDMR